MEAEPNDWRANRDKRMAPRHVMFWCDGCDANHVNGTEKCKVCGTKGKRRHLRKDTNS